MAAVKDNRYKMSAERLEELKKELEELETVRTQEIAEQIKEARSFGDLSENSEYDEAKSEQGKLYSKIAEIKDLIENAEIVTMSKSKDKVGTGTKVTLKDLELDEVETYQIVGSQEADPENRKMSDDSPIGKAIMGKRAGDVVTVEAPVGELRFEIVSISR